MLKHLSILISNCDSHSIDSFLHDFWVDLYRREFAAASRNQKPLSMDKCVSDFLSCTVIDGCHSGTSDIHSGGTCFLREPLIIQKPYGLIFVHSHLNTVSGFYVVRLDWQLFYSAAPEWSWHNFSFLTYVVYNYTHVNVICQLFMESIYR